MAIKKDDREKEYEFGFVSNVDYVYKSKRGLSREIIEEISRLKNEPIWMRDFRLDSYEIFKSKKMPEEEPPT